MKTIVLALVMGTALPLHALAEAAHHSTEAVTAPAVQEAASQAAGMKEGMKAGMQDKMANMHEGMGDMADMHNNMHGEGHGMVNGMQDKKMSMEHGDMGMAGEGEGVIKALLPDRQQVVIDHEPVASHNWPKMTMGFAVTDAKLLEGLSVGDKVSFKFTAKGMNGVISAITKQ
ncbi:Copper binding protein CusF [Atopomonas hussainii]|uniref:Copper binding protein CusF n=1 Tax=Atopomonas hussainii TaxID=1429083 RepID=A0A1H7KX57_9GAMM|nr:copper-binding protein [Atopomonas hussainii]SEK91144.1 Copper binding protein CusF [Atopomonas hussainii]